MPPSRRMAGSAHQMRSRILSRGRSVSPEPAAVPDISEAPSMLSVQEAQQPKALVGDQSIVDTVEVGLEQIEQLKDLKKKVRENRDESARELELTTFRQALKQEITQQSLSQMTPTAFQEIDQSSRIMESAYKQLRQEAEQKKSLIDLNEAMKVRILESIHYLLFQMT